MTSNFADLERTAHAFHDAYESIAPLFGYVTRRRTAVPWEDVPADNRSVMVATVRYLVDTGAIIIPPECFSPRR